MPSAVSSFDFCHTHVAVNTTMRQTEQSVKTVKSVNPVVSLLEGAVATIDSVLASVGMPATSPIGVCSNVADLSLAVI